jgi:uncharacterized RDD family membrane protein YckC
METSLPSNLTSATTGATDAGPVGLVADTPQYAGFWSRAKAVFVDSLILAFVSSALQAAAGPWMTSLLNSAVGSASATVGVLLTLAALWVVIDWLYYAIQESSAAQATVGKRVANIKVTNLEGRRISFWLATARYFAKFVSAALLMLGFLMAAFTQHKQALHDMMVGTLVVRAR